MSSDVECLQMRDQLVEPVAVLGDERVVDRAGVGRRPVDEQAVERLEQGQVAVDPDLQEQVGQRRAPAHQPRTAAAGS